MTGRERVDAALNFQEPDRIAIHDSPWSTAITRWHQEGLPEDQSPDGYFGYEFSGYGFDGSLRLPTQVVEETDEYTIAWNADGALRKNWKNIMSTPECIDFKIKTPSAWEEVKANMEFTPDRVDVEAAKQAQQAANEAGKWFPFSGAMGYDRTQGIPGSERLLIAMAQEPEWPADMFMTVSQLIVDAGEYLISEGVEFDGVFVYDDNGYRNASLFSPAAYKQQLQPAHKLVYDWAHSHGFKVILHSCGCVKELIPYYLEAGLDCLQPLEVKAGMDLIELKKQYDGRLAFMGGIDVRCMANPDPRAIEDEISTKIPFAMKGGGYIYHSDHSVPDNVSFEQYKRTIELVLEYGTY